MYVAPVVVLTNSGGTKRAVPITDFNGFRQMGSGTEIRQPGGRTITVEEPFDQVLEEFEAVNTGRRKVDTGPAKEEA